jgi:geranylgeranyl diphosphate synthase type II
VIHALRHASGPRRQTLIAFLRRARADRSPSQICRVRTLMQRTGAMDHARTTARVLAGAALCEFDRYFAHVANSRDIQFMRNLVTWVLERSH